MKIITHDGTFHTDEVFAIALLKKFVKSNIEVIRTRDESILEESKKDKNIFVIDVGRDYNFGMKNFDHHQREFNVRWKEDDILYSSCGLIWNFLKRKGYLKKYSKTILLNIERKLIKKIDLHDNGAIFWSLSNMVKTCNRESNTMEDFNKSLDLASFYLDNIFYQESLLNRLDNVFHTDEVFAIALLKSFFNTDLTLMRTNDQLLLKEHLEKVESFIISPERDYSIIVKDLTLNRKKVNNKWRDGVDFSSCGVVWNFLKKNGYLNKYSNKTLKSIEKKLIKKIDANSSNKEFWAISNMIKISNKQNNTAEDFNKAVGIAVTYIENMFIQEIHADSLKAFFEEDLKKYKDDKIFFSSISNNGSFLKYLSVKTNAEVLIYKHVDEEGLDRWYAKSITKYNTIKKDNYEVFSALAPESWRGLSNVGLKNATGFKGSIFVHKTGYLCVAKNKKTISLMAKEMLKNRVKIKEECN